MALNTYSLNSAEWFFNLKKERATRVSLPSKQVQSPISSPDSRTTDPNVVYVSCQEAEGNVSPGIMQVFQLLTKGLSSDDLYSFAEQLDKKVKRSHHPFVNDFKNVSEWMLQEAIYRKSKNR